MKKITNKTLIIISLLLPVTTYAALDGVRTLITSFGSFLNQVITIVFGLAVLFFFWGIGQFVLHSGDEKTRTEGKKKIMWGVIALFVMVSIWGIIGFIGNIFGIDTSKNLGGPLQNPCQSYQSLVNGVCVDTP